MSLCHIPDFIKKKQELWVKETKTWTMNLIYIYTTTIAKQRKNSQTNEWNVQYLKILHEYSFWLNYYFYPCGHGFGSACLSVTVRNKIS